MEELTHVIKRVQKDSLLTHHSLLHQLHSGSQPFRHSASCSARTGSGDPHSGTRSACTFWPLEVRHAAHVNRPPRKRSHWEVDGYAKEPRVQRGVVTLTAGAGKFIGVVSAVVCAVTHPSGREAFPVPTLELRGSTRCPCVYDAQTQTHSSAKRAHVLVIIYLGAKTGRLPKSKDVASSEAAL